MSVTAWKAASVANNTGSGTAFAATTGTLSTAIAVQDSNYCYANNIPDNGSLSQELVTSGYGFSTTDIPSTATILGIEVRVWKKFKTPATFGVFAHDYALKIAKAGVTSSASGVTPTSTAWPGTITSFSYGSSSELWDLSWIPTDIYDSGFGFSIITQCQTTTIVGSSITPQVDLIEMRVYYTTANVSISVPLMTGIATTLPITVSANTVEIPLPLLSGQADSLAPTVAIANAPWTSSLTSWSTAARSANILTWDATNAANAQTFNNVFVGYDSTTLSGGGGAGHSNYLTGVTLSNPFPSGAVITSIVVRISRKRQPNNNPTARDDTVYLIKAGAILTGINKASGSNWPTSNTEVSYTFSGANLTSLGGFLDTDVNNSGFGVALSTFNDDAVNNDGYDNLLVDSILVDIYYISGGATISAPLMSGSATMPDPSYATNAPAVQAPLMAGSATAFQPTAGTVTAVNATTWTGTADTATPPSIAHGHAESMALLSGNSATAITPTVNSQTGYIYNAPAISTILRDYTPIVSVGGIIIVPLAGDVAGDTNPITIRGGVIVQAPYPPGGTAALLTPSVIGGHGVLKFLPLMVGSADWLTATTSQTSNPQVRVMVFLAAGDTKPITVSAAGNISVTSTLMTGSALALAPNVTVIRNPSVQVTLMTGVATMPTPSMQHNKRVFALLLGNVYGATFSPTVRYGLRVTSPLMTGSATTQVPHVGFGFRVLPSVFTGTANTQSPTVVAGMNARIQAPKFMGSANTLAITVQGHLNYAAQVALMTGSAHMLIPSIRAAWEVSVGLLTGSATTLSPTISKTSSIRVLFPILRGAATTLTPSVIGHWNSSLHLGLLHGITTMPTPVVLVHANRSVSVLTWTGAANTQPPQVRLNKIVLMQVWTGSAAAPIASVHLINSATINLSLIGDAKGDTLIPYVVIMATAPSMTYQWVSNPISLQPGSYVIGAMPGPKGTPAFPFGAYVTPSIPIE